MSVCGGVILVTRRGGLCYCPGGDSCVGGLSWMCVRLVASAPVASAVAVAVAAAAAALATVALAATAALALSPARTPPPRARPTPTPPHAGPAQSAYMKHVRVVCVAEC